jgi:hypothetical protein
MDTTPIKCHAPDIKPKPQASGNVGISRRERSERIKMEPNIL